MTRFGRTKGIFGDKQEVAKRIETIIADEFDCALCPAYTFCDVGNMQAKYKSCVYAISNWLDEEV